jgi:hypothetical protein
MKIIGQEVTPKDAKEETTRTKGMTFRLSFWRKNTHKA